MSLILVFLDKKVNFSLKNDNEQEKYKVKQKTSLKLKS